jgi:predicted AAA+ superfamily ATPase
LIVSFDSIKNNKYYSIGNAINEKLNLINMHDLIQRKIEYFVKENLNIFPAIVILGPRQCGKSTLIRMMSGYLQDFIYLDLQNRDDIAKLSEPSLFFQANKQKTICLDEIQLIPDMFSILRSEIDINRRLGRFILLGSASRDLIQHSAESLAGRIGIIELTPFLISELSIEKGFDIIAHSHGQVFNASKLGESLGLTHPTVKRYLDLLEQTFILRSLQAYVKNVKKRIIKSPKVYVRDTGLLHRLLQINDFNSLMGNPIFGASWEGLVIENICSSINNCEFSFFRSATGDEIDLIIHKPNEVIAIECKASTAPKLSKGFWRSLAIVKPDKTYIVAPVNEKYPIAKNVVVCGLIEVLDLLINDFD